MATTVFLAQDYINLDDIPFRKHLSIFYFPKYLSQPTLSTFPVGGNRRTQSYSSIYMQFWGFAQKSYFNRDANKLISMSPNNIKLISMRVYIKIDYGLLEN